MALNPRPSCRAHPLVPPHRRVSSRRGAIPRYHAGIAEQWKTFLVRVTPEQHAKLERIAEQKERSLAWVVRNMIDRVTEK